MLYNSYQWQDDLVAPVRGLARESLRLLGRLGPETPVRRRTLAALEMLERFRLSHSRPDFAIH